MVKALANVVQSVTLAYPAILKRPELVLQGP